MSQYDPRLFKAVTAHSSIVATLHVMHSLRTRGLRRTLLFTALGNGIPILGELLAIHVLKLLRHHVQPQIRVFPWPSPSAGTTLATLNGAFNAGDKPRVSKSLIPIVALVATSFDLLLDPFGLDLGLWEWSEGGPYAPDVKASTKAPPTPRGAYAARDATPLGKPPDHLRPGLLDRRQSASRLQAKREPTSGLEPLT